MFIIDMSDKQYEGIILSTKQDDFNHFERLIKDDIETVIVFKDFDLYNPYLTGRLLTITENSFKNKTVIVKPRIFVFNALVSRANKVIYSELDNWLVNTAKDNIHNLEIVRFIADIIYDKATTNISENLVKEVVNNELPRLKKRT